MENAKPNTEQIKSILKSTSGSSSSENSDIPTDTIKPKPPKKNKTSKYKYVKYGAGYVSLYITSFEKDLPPKVDVKKLKEALPNINLKSIIETECGVMINLLDDAFVNKILKLNLAKIFGKPVQVVPLFSEQYKKTVRFKEIPWCIRNEEIEICLQKQGINYGKLTREKSTVYIEVSDFPNYQRLKEEGINFYDSVKFRACEENGLNEELHYNTDNIIQCYRCQGFWHTANTCKQNIRCVRCGEEHQVEHCNRPKHNPICCNCKGPHHAAYKLCPVRLKLKKTMRVSFSFSQ